MHELAAWILFPLIALAICCGVGLLATRLARADVRPAAIPALGFAAAIVVLGPLFATGAGEWPAAVLLVVLAVVGFVSAQPRRVPRGPGVLAGLATYCLYIAPVALTGSATFLGYNLLNDTAIHLALVDWIGDHGSRWVAQPPSSYASAMHEYVGTHYPLGSHELLAALRPLVGLDPALIYQPFLAVSAAFAAAAVFSIVRGEWVGRWGAAVIAFAALAGQLVFSFSLQGGIKEMTFITCLAGAAALARRPALMALPAAALYAIYGVYGLPWIVALAVVALVVARPVLREFAVGAVVFVMAIAAELPGSIDYWRHGHSVITKASELGPLAGPLKFVQIGGVWTNGDYRFTPAHSWITYGLDVVVLAFAVVGVVAAVRRRSVGPLVLVGAALFGWVVVQPTGSPYVAAKALAVLSPAVLVAGAIGVAVVAARRRRVGLGVAVVLGLALLVSDALAYRMVLPAPMKRLGELAAIDKRFAGKGPVLVNEYEAYVKHYMRRSGGSDPYESWAVARARLTNSKLKVGGHAYDLDQFVPSFVQGYRLIALRRSPAESRPPSNYRRVWSGRFYEVWRRVGPAPTVHVALGSPPLDPTAPLSCRRVRALPAAGSVTAAMRPRPIVVGLRSAPLPPGWYHDAQDKHALDVRKGGSMTVSFNAGGPLQLWLRGRTFRRDAVLVDGRLVGVAHHDNGPNQWIEVGVGTLKPGRHTLELRRPKRSLRPGDAQTDVIGPFELVRDVPERLVSGPALRAECGKPADWVEVAHG